jgi:hypothetical protein
VELAPLPITTELASDEVAVFPIVIELFPFADELAPIAIAYELLEVAVLPIDIDRFVFHWHQSQFATPQQSNVNDSRWEKRVDGFAHEILCIRRFFHMCSFVCFSCVVS